MLFLLNMLRIFTIVVATFVISAGAWCCEKHAAMAPPAASEISPEQQSCCGTSECKCGTAEGESPTCLCGCSEHRQGPSEPVAPAPARNAEDFGKHHVALAKAASSDVQHTMLSAPGATTSVRRASGVSLFLLNASFRT